VNLATAPVLPHGLAEHVNHFDLVD
jgi:hypothetical protein